MFSAPLYERVVVISDLFAADFHRKPIIIISGRPSFIFRLAAPFSGHLTGSRLRQCRLHTMSTLLPLHCLRTSLMDLLRNIDLFFDGWVAADCGILDRIVDLAQSPAKWACF